MDLPILAAELPAVRLWLELADALSCPCARCRLRVMVGVRLMAWFEGVGAVGVA